MNIGGNSGAGVPHDRRPQGLTRPDIPSSSSGPAGALAAAQLAPETGALWLSSPQLPSVAGADSSGAAGCPQTPSDQLTQLNES